LIPYKLFCYLELVDKSKDAKDNAYKTVKVDSKTDNSAKNVNNGNSAENTENHPAYNRANNEKNNKLNDKGNNVALLNLLNGRPIFL